jgi:ribosomal protein S18 acetylase RimI-like enzyme
MNSGKDLSIKEIFIEPFQKKDIFELADIGKLCLPIYYSAFHLLEIINQKDYINRKLVIKTPTKQKYTIGLIIVKKINEHHNHIMSIAILKLFRGKLFGSRLIKYIKALYPNSKITLYVQSVNMIANAFYKKHGFQVVKYYKDYYSTLDDKDANFCEYKLI